MANLLNTLRAWGESLFTAKKGFIAEQSLPNGETVYQESSDLQGSTTIPFDGWCRIQAHCNYIQANSDGLFFTIGNQGNIYPCLSLPVRKGQTVAWDVQGLVDGSVSAWFVHNQSGQ